MNRLDLLAKHIIPNTTTKNNNNCITTCSASSTTTEMEEVCIVSYARTPIGRFGGSFKALSAIDLAAVAIKGSSPLILYSK